MYMAIGGTNFGFWAGSNSNKDFDVTSYGKFKNYKIRKNKTNIIKKYLNFKIMMPLSMKLVSKPKNM